MGDRCFLSKNDRMVPFFFFFFFFWGDAFVAFAGRAGTGISSSVAGGVERSESDMLTGGWSSLVRCAAGRSPRQTMEQANEVIPLASAQRLMVDGQLAGNCVRQGEGGVKCSSKCRGDVVGSQSLYIPRS